MSASDRFPTIGETLRFHALGRATQVALVCGDQRLTWAELDARVDRLAAALVGDGMGSGDRLLWLGQNCHRLFEGMLAAARIGAVFCPVNWRQSPAELAFVIDDVDPLVVIWQEDEVGPNVRDARTISSGSETARWIQHDGPASGSGYEEYLASAEPSSDQAPEVDASEPFLMVYTAAFEGRPHGALLSHRAWLLQNLMTAYVAGTTASDVCLCAGPMFHVGTLRHALSTFQLGGRNVVARRVDAEELCRIVDAEGCTVSFLQEPTLSQMVACNAEGKFDLTSLRNVQGSDAWNAMVSFEQRPLRNGFGQTEVTGIVTFADAAGADLGGAGRPIPLAELRVVNTDGRTVAVGETGEIVVRGPVVMNGYHRRPELNEQRQKGGWHHTRDLGRREADGSLSFVGPATRMIKSASENIYPAEVEACIRAHASVQEVGVIGVPDPVWAQSVLAIVVPRPGVELDADAIIEHCRGTIASYKKPRRVEFVDALPRTSTGAVDYDELDAQFGGGGYPSK